MWDEDDTQPPIRVGEGVPGAEPVDLPDRYDHCGHCGTGLVGLPNPEQWVPGILGDGESVKIWAVQRCFNCDVPSIGTWLAVPGDGGVAKLTDYRLSPLSKPDRRGVGLSEATCQRGRRLLGESRRDVRVGVGG